MRRADSRYQMLKKACGLLGFLGYLVNTELRKLLKAKDPEQQKKVIQTTCWIQKKAAFHPAQMLKIADQIAQQPDFYQPLAQLGYEPKKIRSDVQMIAVLHDIGRLSEVDIKNGTKFDYTLVSKNQHDHAFESERILRSIGVERPEILLPIKYHGLVSFEFQIKQDPLFMTLNKKTQKQIM